VPNPPTDVRSLRLPTSTHAAIATSPSQNPVVTGGSVGPRGSALEAPSEPPVTLEMRRTFDQSGFVKVEGVITQEHAAELREAIVAEVASYKAGRRTDDPRYIFARTNHILEISNLFNIVEGFTSLWLHRRLARIGAALIDAHALRVYHDALLYKTDEHNAVPWHQDEYFSVLDGKAITAWMPLVPVTEDEGSLVYAASSGAEGLLDRSQFVDDDAVDAHLRSCGYHLVATAMTPGDVLFHTNQVFHRSNVNSSPEPRSAFSVFLFEDGARIREPIFGKRGIVDMIYFPGCETGDKAITSLNPVVFRQDLGSDLEQTPTFCE